MKNKFSAWKFLTTTLAAFSLFASSFSSSRAEELNLNRFEQDIKNFENKDQKQKRTSAETVFVGSSTFTMWKQLETDFSEFKAINRGFGGSTLPEINHYFDQLVCKYKPKRVVLYAGTNDIAELHHTGKEVEKDVEAFYSKLSSCCPEAEFYFVSMSMAPCRTEFENQYNEGNRAVLEFMKHTKHAHYINVVPLMRDKQNRLRADLFGLDRLHMTESGYALWKPAIMKALR